MSYEIVGFLSGMALVAVALAMVCRRGTSRAQQSIHARPGHRHRL